MNCIKFIRIFLLVLIVLGIGLLATQKMWVPKVVEMILKNDNKELQTSSISDMKNKPTNSASTTINTSSWEVPIDLVKCRNSETRLFSWDLGSKTINVIGLNGSNCGIEYTTETEGGYTRYNCKIPVSLSRISSGELETSKYCTIIKTGNFLLENN